MLTGPDAIARDWSRYGSGARDTTAVAGAVVRPRGCHVRVYYVTTVYLRRRAYAKMAGGVLAVAATPGAALGLDTKLGDGDRQAYEEEHNIHGC